MGTTGIAAAVFHTRRRQEKASVTNGTSSSSSHATLGRLDPLHIFELDLRAARRVRVRCVVKFTRLMCVRTCPALSRELFLRRSPMLIREAGAAILGG